MKKTLMVFTFLYLCVSIASAQVFIGSRQAGMGGTGVASAVGLNAVAYNPAGLMKGPSGEILLSLGAAATGMNQISDSLASASDPGKFMLDNYDSKLDVSGSISGILGVNVNHVGVSILLPSISSTLSKNAGTLVGSFDNIATGALVLTLGRSFSTPLLPFAALDVGANLKALSLGQGIITIPNDPTFGNPVSPEATYWRGSAIGLDLGARATIDIPALTDFSIGFAMRNIWQNVVYKPTTKTMTYTIPSPGQDPILTEGPESEGPSTDASYPIVTALGCAGTIPGIGLKFATDIESIGAGKGALSTSSDTVTHLGLEYPLLYFLVLRAGLASGQNVSMTTLGAKINIPFLTLEFANIIDGKNSKNTSYVVDVGVAF